MPIKQKIQSARKSLAKKRQEYLAPRPHRSFRKTRKQRTRPELATIKDTAFGAFRTLWQEKRVLGGLAIFYMVATYIFVGGIAQSDFSELQKATLQVFGGNVGSIGTAVSLLASTMGGAFNQSMTELQQFLEIFIAILFWLALVWALRMRFAEQRVKIRDALYNSGAPIIAYVIVGLIIVLQLTPGVVGIYVFSVAQSGVWLQGGVEVMLFAMAAFLLVCLSIYWVSSSLIALVVVTLPQMYPWRAVAIAGELAIGRRMRLIGHVIVLLIILFLLWLVVLLPALLLYSWLRFDWLPLVPIVVQILGALTIMYVAAYVYRLYRSML